MSNERYSLELLNYHEHIPRREKEKVIERLDYCRAMLHMHGFLGDAEDRRVTARITKIRKMMVLPW